MRLTLFAIVLVFGLLNCKDKEVIVNIQTNGHLTIIDSVPLTENLRLFESGNNYGVYPIYYAGVLLDTIKLSKQQIPRYGHGEKVFDNKMRFRPPDSTSLSIFVDTAFNLTHSFNYKRFLPEGTIVELDSTVYYKAYAVITKNLSDSLILLSECWVKGFFVMQAMSQHGEWVDIEIPDRLDCGTGCRSVVVEPNQILVSKLMRYSGDFKTELRLKYSRWGHTVYSNSFTDNIYKTQLPESM